MDRLTESIEQNETVILKTLREKERGGERWGREREEGERRGKKGERKTRTDKETGRWTNIGPYRQTERDGDRETKR